jgi:hypothetical protein
LVQAFLKKWWVERKGFGCQTASLKIIEDWKKALDENKYIAAILMDLSKDQQSKRCH